MAQAQMKTNQYPTEPGWYAIGFEDSEGVIEYGPIFRFDGVEWFDEGIDSRIGSLWYPDMQVYVGLDAAHSYLRQ